MYTQARSRGGEIFDFLSGEKGIRSARIRDDKGQGVTIPIFLIKKLYFLPIRLDLNSKHR